MSLDFSAIQDIPATAAAIAKAKASDLTRDNMESVLKPRICWLRLNAEKPPAHEVNERRGHQRAIICRKCLKPARAACLPVHIASG